jgi:hypothetical protein
MCKTKQEAVKLDQGKPKMYLLPPKALNGIAEALTYGAIKYKDFNYKLGEGLDLDRPFSACIRHLNKWNDGEDIDGESGLSHLKHAGACIVMLLDLVESEIGKDTRFKKPLKPAGICGTCMQLTFYNESHNCVQQVSLD